MQWKKKKMEAIEAGLAAQRAERAKNDRMRFLSSHLSLVSNLGSSVD